MTPNASHLHPPHEMPKKTMKPDSKTFVVILAYCAVLWLTNWSLSHEYAREVGMTSSTLDMRVLGALIGFVATFVLSRRIWRITRAFLDVGVRIPKSVRLWGSWNYLFLLLPLAIRITYHTSGTADDGAGVQTVIEYGGGASWASALFSAIAIMLFQLLAKIESFNPDNEEAKQASPDRPLPAALFQ